MFVYFYFRYRNNVQVSTDARVVVDDRQGGSLNIAGLSVNDNGVYSCEVRLSEDSKDEVPIVSQKNFPLMIARPDAANIRVLPQDATVQKGGSARFDCVFDNAQRVEWFHPRGSEGPLRNDTKRGHAILPNGTLLINEVKGNDGGAYQCVGVMAGEEALDERPVYGYLAELKIFGKTEVSEFQEGSG